MSKLTQALYATTSANATSLANVNFDFSLMKVEPTAEYLPLGSALSIARRRAAEDGVIHSTCRKLAALFSSGLPATPNLLKAYGKRVSEIVQSYQLSKEASKTKLWAFKEWSGVDATSIWAAATSGQSAIQLHLLACMLARFWTPSEAIAIWVEFVQERKRRLDEKLDDGVDLHQAMASRISFTRAELAEIDASARAYLATADGVKKRESTQLHLLLNNIYFPVNTNPSLFDSVWSTWTSAMTLMEGYLKGIPYMIRDGSVLVGISAWHIYPDFYILSKTVKKVCLHDPIVNSGGLVTIGSADSSERYHGIEWSLPLACMRSYGDPVVIRQLLQDSNFRLTMEEVILVAFGSLMSRWKVQDGDLPKVVEMVILLCDAIDFFLRSTNLGHEDTKTMRQKFQCLSMLRQPAKRITDSSKGSEAEDSWKLIRFGLRRCRVFLAEDQAQAPPVLFGLRNPHRLIRQLKMPQDRLSLLRKIASEMDAEDDSLLIRYSILGVGEQGFCHVYSTALPFIIPNGAASTSNTNSRELSHASWAAECALSVLGEKAFILDANSVFSNTVTGEIFWRGAPIPFGTPPDSDGESIPSDCISTSVTVFEFVFGDPLRAAIFKKRGSKTNPPEEVKDHLVRDVLSKGSLDYVSFLRELGGLASEKQIIVSLSALSAATRLYEKLPDARINAKILDQPLTKAQWVQRLSFDARKHSVAHWDELPLNLSEAFSCIAWFETGEVDLAPSSLDQIMALAVDNSIYVPTVFIRDPSEKRPPGQLIRITGSLGKSGMSLMVSVLNPVVRPPDVSTWTLINHAPWDGKMEDRFTATSLHLKLIDWRTPFTIPDRSKPMNVEVSLQEAVVAIFNEEKWIGDLDVLPNLNKAKRLSYNPRECTHDPQDPAVIPEDITAIDSWDEFIDLPLTSSIVRCHGNWLARLATTIFGTQLGYPIIILPKVACKVCVIETIQRLKAKRLTGEDESDSLIFIC